MMKQKYRITFRCDCGNEFKKVTTNRDLELATCPKCKRKESDKRFRLGDGAVSENDLVPAPPIVGVDKYHCKSCSKIIRFHKETEDDKLAHCHHCGSQDVRFVGTATAGIIAQASQTMIKALDKTAEMTMKTYGMSDINMDSNMRPGDTCMPKLPPVQQNMVDSFFDHKKSNSNINFNKIGRQALAGAFSNQGNPVAALHERKERPHLGKIMDGGPVKVNAGQKVSSYDRMLRGN